MGTQIALDSDYETQRQSLLKLLAALEEAGKLGEVNAIHLGDLSCISMDYMDRFTVKLDYDADFAYELQLLEMSIASDKIQDNMTGTFDMRQREDGSIHFRQNVRGIGGVSKSGVKKKQNKFPATLDLTGKIAYYK